jgi:ribose 5-phosphate isomerase B
VRLVLASDHAGFELKGALASYLASKGEDSIEDIGTYSTDPVDYPPFCARAARIVVAGDADFGVVIGGSGNGEAIAANKVRGARAAVCYDEYTARFSRLHNNANVLSLGARLIAPELATVILDVFLSTSFEGGRHLRRIDELTEIEDEEAAR